MSFDLIIATINGDSKLVIKLLSSLCCEDDDCLYSQVNVRDPLYGNTSLHYAVKMGNFEIVRILLTYGADRNIKNCNGILAMDEFEDQALNTLMCSGLSC